MRATNGDRTLSEPAAKLPNEIPCMVCGGASDCFGKVELHEALSGAQPAFALFLPAYHDEAIRFQGLYVCRKCGHGFVAPRLSDRVIGLLHSTDRGVDVSPAVWSEALFSDVPYQNRWLDRVRIPPLQRIVDARVNDAVRLLDVGASGGTLSLGLNCQADLVLI